MKVHLCAPTERELDALRSFFFEKTGFSIYSLKHDPTQPFFSLYNNLETIEIPYVSKCTYTNSLQTLPNVHEFLANPVKIDRMIGEGELFRVYNINDTYAVSIDKNTGCNARHAIDLVARLSLECAPKLFAFGFTDQNEYFIVSEYRGQNVQKNDLMQRDKVEKIIRELYSYGWKACDIAKIANWTINYKQWSFIDFNSLYRLTDREQLLGEKFVQECVCSVIESIEDSI
jgi:hypothetical protein